MDKTTARREKRGRVNMNSAELPVIGACLKPEPVFNAFIAL